MVCRMKQVCTLEQAVINKPRSGCSGAASMRPTNRLMNVSARRTVSGWGPVSVCSSTLENERADTLENKIEDAPENKLKSAREDKLENDLEKGMAIRIPNEETSLRLEKTEPEMCMEK